MVNFVKERPEEFLEGGEVMRVVFYALGGDASQRSALLERALENVETKQGDERDILVRSGMA